MQLVDGIMRRMENPETPAPSLPADTASPPDELGSIILTVNVELTDRQQLLPLVVREGHTVLEAVEGFLLDNKLSRSSSPVLCQVRVCWGCIDRVGLP